MPVVGFFASLVLAVLLVALSNFANGATGANDDGAVWVLQIGLMVATALPAFVIGISVYVQRKGAAGQALMLRM